MLYFPQLLSGATAQYPFVKRRVYRTAATATLDGRLLKLSDPAWARFEWELAYRTLTAEERDDLEAFHRSVEGRLGEFTFLDPTENLLGWSGDLDRTIWEKGPLLSLAGGLADPDGGENATRVTNSAAASQTLQQAIHGPAWFHYCFSLFVRSDSPTSLTLFRSTGGNEEGTVHTARSVWRKLTHSGKSQGADETVTFGIRLDAGSAVEVYGMQVDAQPAPSADRKTTSRSGVHENARFDDDSLTFVAEAPEQHSCTVRIVAAALTQ